MGSSAGNGTGGGPDLGGMGGLSNLSNQPHATEYTLQGVMRFLQTEWHRHERDRNAWEIEKQEMRARIATLEGQTRRADATQKALKKYVTILEKKVKDQAGQLKAVASGGTAVPSDAATSFQKFDRELKIQERLRSEQRSSTAADADIIEGVGEDESQRADLRAFLNQCQQEFTYLMMAPANPMPPPNALPSRESPPLPLGDDMREGEFNLPPGPQPTESGYGQPLRPNQNHVRDLNARQGAPPNHAPPAQPGAVSYAPKGIDGQPTGQMIRSNPNDHHASYSGGGGAQWTAGNVTSEVRSGPDDSFKRGAHNNEAFNTSDAATDEIERSDAWDFGNDGFPEPTSASPASSPHPQQIAQAQRPDIDVFPTAENLPQSPNRPPNSHRRKGSMTRRRSAEHELSLNAIQKAQTGNFKLRYGLRGHLDTVRTVIFSGGGSPGEPEICTAGDDGMIKRFHIPRDNNHLSASGHGNNTTFDLDVLADFTHRGHAGAVLSLTSWSPSPNFSTGGRAQGDGWIFSGGQDATIRVWERGRVDPKATIEGHTDAVWALCVLPATLGAVFGPNNQHGTPDRILLVSGAADGTVRLWAVSAPPQLTSPQPGGVGGAKRGGPAGGGGRVRGNSMSSGSAFPSSPQPTMASNSPFHQRLIHNISRSNGSRASPTSIAPLSNSGEQFVVAYSDAAIIVYDTRTGEEIAAMASLETYDGTLYTSVNSVVATTVGLDHAHGHTAGGGSGTAGEDDVAAGPTGGGRAMAGSGVEGTIISGHEDRFVRFFDANSGQCTYNMLAHPASISSLSLSPDGRELVSAGHDASLRFWSLEKRSCTQEMTSHRIMRGEGVCTVVWSQDGRWVVSGGGDGVVKVFAK